MWEAIKTRNLGAERVKEARLQTLITEFENLKMSDNNNIDAYAAKLSGIASKSATLGEVMSEHKLVKKFLASLPRRFFHIVAALEEVLDLKTTRCPYQKRDNEANLSEAHDGDVNHEEGTFLMMNHVQEMILMNEEKYTSPKIESNTEEDDVWKGLYFVPMENGEQKLLKDIYYIHALHSNVISLGQATISGCDIRIRGDFLTMCDSCGSLLIKVPQSTNHLYKTQLKVRKPYCLLDNIDEGRGCGTYDLGISALVRYMWYFLLKHKSDALGVIKRFKTSIEKQMGDSTNVDGSLCTSTKWNCKKKNQTLLEMTRCIIKARGVPNYFWGEAVRHATYIINQTPTRALVGVTLYEKFYGEKPNLEDLTVFGCVAYERTVSKHLKKLDDRSKPLVYLGKEPSSGGFRLYNPHENKIIISVYVVFDEKKGWKWKEDTNQGGSNGTVHATIPATIHATVPTTIHAIVPVTVAATVPGQSPHPVHSLFNSPQMPTDEDDSEDGDVAISVRCSTRNKVLPTRLVYYQLNVHELITFDEEPRNYNEAKWKPQWLKAMKTKLDSIIKNNTWKLVPLPKGVVPIGLKWLFKIKRIADSSIMKYKARFVAKGYV
ncbi:uncharacterized mitochondrial protein-like protein [Tanacetum coccineum]|uniref:Uncharacterized mitochondrial protein-like protein n=1 Tax=Tanacetum coccineum TaxID=301880 RepID=A0ABQ5B580_9ASTR